MISAKSQIMVQIAEAQWTQEALHRACVLARSMNAEIVLMKMLPVQHPQWLGTDLGYLGFTKQDRTEIHNYAATAEDYGVPFSTCIFQYADLTDALVQAAESIHADIVFATLPKCYIPYWREFQLSNLRRQLARQQCVLIEDLSVSPNGSYTFILHGQKPHLMLGKRA